LSARVMTTGQNRTRMRETFTGRFVKTPKGQRALPSTVRAL
jgi:hypothetical protein